MSWEFWGIVSGLLVMLAVFFACMEVLYHRMKTGAAEKTATSLESCQEVSSEDHAA